MHENNKKGASPLAGEDGQSQMSQSQSTTHHYNPIDRVLDSLRELGHSPKQSSSRSGEWMCSCPSHDDRTPSLSIKHGDDQRVLLHCHAGCPVESVVQSLGLAMGDLFERDQNVTTVSVSSAPHGVKKRSSVGDSGGSPSGYERLDDAIGVYTRSMGQADHRWDYHTQHGDLVGVVLRWNTENGKEFRPVSFVDGRWKFTGMPAPRPLYGLPALVDSQGPVVVCEGEKAADAAIACGYIATTSPNGSKSASKADWSVLRGREIVIIPDLDGVGDAYADDITDLCVDAASVRIVDLSQVWTGLEKGDDLADVLALESGDVESVRVKLDALISQTTPEQSRNNSERTARNHQPFPVELLPEPVRSYIVQGAQAIGCDASYIALPVLSMLGGAIGNTHEVRVKRGWIEPPVVWSCIVGRSGTSKSPAIELAFKPLEKIQERLFLEYQRELEEFKADPNHTGPNGSAPSPQRCIIDDATIEATLQCIQQNPHGIVQRRDELAGWFDFDRYKSGKGVGSNARWIELFHGRSVSIDRRTSDPIFVARAAMSIAGGIQPGVLSRVMDPNNLESGLVARFLFAMPEAIPKRWSDATIDPVVSERMHGLVERLHSHTMYSVAPDASAENPKPHVMGLDPDATRAFGLFVDQHNESIQNQPEHIGSAWTKLECYVPRLALIIHLVREAAGDATLLESEFIGLDSIQAAIGLVEWFKTETNRLYTILAMDKSQQEDLRVIEWINAQSGAVTVREFSRGLAQFNNAQKAQHKLDELVDAGFGFFRGRRPNGKTQEFVLHNEYQSNPVTTVTVTSGAKGCKNNQTVTGASGRYPVQSNKKDQ